MQGQVYLFLAFGLYNILLIVGILFGWPVAVLYLLATPKARAGLLEKLGWLQPSFQRQLFEDSSYKKRVWFHAVSVGEFNAIRGLINLLSSDYRIVISTTTLTSQTLAKQVYPQHAVFYFPLDLPWVVDGVIRRVQPDLLVLTETELWPNVILGCYFHKTPIMMVNGRLSERSFAGYTRLRWFFAPIIRQLEALAAQTPEDADRFAALGASSKQIAMLGNLKFDTDSSLDPNGLPEKVQSIKNVLNFPSDAPVITFASTHSGEDAGFIDCYQKLKTVFLTLRMVLVPRHPERAAEVEALLHQKGLRYSCRTALGHNASNTEDVVVVDTIGELVNLYGISTVAVIGGSFIPKRGGQNPIEAIQQGVPVVFGPYMSNFKAIVWTILTEEAGIQVTDISVLTTTITALLQDEDRCQRFVDNGYRLLAKHQGATPKTAELIRQCVG